MLSLNFLATDAGQWKGKWLSTFNSQDNFLNYYWWLSSKATDMFVSIEITCFLMTIYLPTQSQNISVVTIWETMISQWQLHVWKHIIIMQNDINVTFCIGTSLMQLIRQLFTENQWSTNSTLEFYISYVLDDSIKLTVDHQFRRHHFREGDMAYRCDSKALSSNSQIVTHLYSFTFSKTLIKLYML